MTNTQKSNKLEIENSHEETFQGSLHLLLGRRGQLVNYQQMACEYLEAAARLDRRLEQLQRENRRPREPDLWVRIGTLMEIRDDLRVTAHVLQRRAARA